MRDDDQNAMNAMDTLLRDALSAPAPRLSADFTAEVLRDIQPRRLSARGRVILGTYAVVAAAVSIWMVRDVPLALTAIGAGVALVAGLGTSLYVRRFV